MQKELIAVISKYVSINPDDIKVSLEKQGNYEVLEVNIVLPEPDGISPIRKTKAGMIHRLPAEQTDGDDGRGIGSPFQAGLLARFSVL